MPSARADMQDAIGYAVTSGAGLDDDDFDPDPFMARLREEGFEIVPTTLLDALLIAAGTTREEEGLA